MRLLHLALPQFVLFPLRTVSSGLTSWRDIYRYDRARSPAIHFGSIIQNCSLIYIGITALQLIVRLLWEGRTGLAQLKTGDETAKDWLLQCSFSGSLIKLRNISVRISLKLLNIQKLLVLISAMKCSSSPDRQPWPWDPHKVKIIMYPISVDSAGFPWSFRDVLHHRQWNGTWK
jgi:hypothetical protein